MSEAEFQKHVMDQARRLGWIVNHVYRSRAGRGKGAWRTTTSYPGFPDLTLLRRGQLVFLELKRVGEKPTPEQRRFIATAQSVPGVRAYVVDPTDWPEVLELLSRRP